MTRFFCIDRQDMAFANCPDCGVVHGFPLTLYNKAREWKSRGGIVCPNGHKWHYTGETDAERLRRERDIVQQQLARAEDERREAEEKATRAERALKRHKKRSAAGTCPCCKRTFAALAEHMKQQHPEFVAESGAQVIPLKRRA